MSNQCKCLLAGFQEIPYEGALTAEIVLCGESPGFEELEKKKPFKGRAGRLLNSSLAETSLTRGELFIINSARCMIQKDRLNASEIKGILASCRPYVELVLHELKPKVIIAAGDFALRQILKKSGITRARKRWFWSKEFSCWVKPMFHPAYILRNPVTRPLFVADLRAVERFRDNGWKPVRDEAGNYLEVSNIDWLLEEKGLVSIDTETQSTDWMSDNSLLLCYTLAYRNNEALMIRFHEECPVQEAEFTIQVPRVIKRKKQLTTVGVRRCDQFDTKAEQLYELMRSDRLQKVFFNGNYDLHFMERFFQRIGWKKKFKVSNYVMDVQAAAVLMDDSIFKRASLSEVQFGVTDMIEDYTSEFEDSFKKDDMISVPVPALKRYACADADVTRRAALVISKQLKEDDRQWNYLKSFLQPTIELVLYELERNGTAVDRDALPEVRQKLEERIDTLWTESLALAGPAVLAEHKQKGLKLTRDAFVRDILFSRKGFDLNPPKETRTKAASIDKETRTKLLESDIASEAKRFLTLYEEWQELSDLYSRNIKGFDKHIKTDGRIHSSFSLARTATGRSSSRDPNMQNIPKRGPNADIIRRLIVAPPGRVLLALDYSQSELRWAAHLSRDVEMTRIFQEGEDIHTNTALAMLKKRADEVDKKTLKDARQKAKPVNFGNLYRMSAPGLVRNAKKEYGIDLTEKQAAEYQASWFRRYPGITTYHERTINFAHKYGYVVSPFGRIRRLPDINSEDWGRSSAAEREAVNHPIQGPSSDTPLFVCMLLLRSKELEPDECLLVNFVHDEIIFEVKDNDRIIRKYFDLIREAMENPPLKSTFGVDPRVPFVADGKVGKNLAEMTAI